MLTSHYNEGIFRYGWSSIQLPYPKWNESDDVTVSLNYLNNALVQLMQNPAD